jgi:hypothetical protein
MMNQALLFGRESLMGSNVFGFLLENVLCYPSLDRCVYHVLLCIDVFRTSLGLSRLSEIF